MKRIVIIEKDWDNWKFSSNINEVTKAVLNLLLFFYEKILHAQKSTKKHKNHKNVSQKRHKNAIKQTKMKNTLMKQLRRKSNLSAYLRFCVFCACEEKKIENKK